MKELIRKLGEYTNIYQNTTIVDPVYYLLCKIVYGS